MVPTPLLDDAQYETFTYVPGKVQVNIRHGCALGRQKTVQRQAVIQRINVRQANQIPHQHGHRGAAPPSRREPLQGRFLVSPSQLQHDLAGQFHHPVIDEKEPRQAMLSDEPEFLIQAFSHPPVAAAVASRCRLLAEPLQP